MKVALASWKGRVSPVFDVSQQVIVFDIQDGEVMAKSEQGLGKNDALQRVRKLVDFRIETLICGAISRSLAGLIAAYGIHLVPFIAGDVDEVLQAYLAKTLPNPDMAMPGCYRCRRRFRRGRHSRRQEP